MKIVYSFCYTLITILYFAIGDGGMLWKVVNISTLLLSVIWLIHLIKENSLVSRKDRLFLWFVQWSVVARLVYTLICSIAIPKWVYEMNLGYSILLAIGLIWVTFYSVKIEHE